MNYNPLIHHRRSIRLKGYDYSKAGAYFITICCHKNQCRFGRIAVRAPLAGAPPKNENSGPYMNEKNDSHLNENNSANKISGDAHMELNEFGKIAYSEWAILPERFPNIELDVFQIMPNHLHGIIILNNPGKSKSFLRQNKPEWQISGTQNIADAMPYTSDELDSLFAHSENNPDEWQLTPGNNDQHTDTLFRNSNESHQSFDDIQPPDGFYPSDGIQPVDDLINVHSKGQPQGLPLPTVGDIVGAYKSLVSNACLAVYKSNNITMGKLWHRNYYDNIIRNEKSYHNISRYIIDNPKNWKGDKFYS